MTQTATTALARKFDFGRVANYEIETLISSTNTFYNYNNTIVAFRHNDAPDVYVITHWNTIIAEYNSATKTIERLNYKHYSTTTSILLGRILRSLPRESVQRWLKEHGEITTYDKRRLIKMLRW